MPFGYAAFNALASCQRRDNAPDAARRRISKSNTIRDPQDRFRETVKSVSKCDPAHTPTCLSLVIVQVGRVSGRWAPARRRAKLWFLQFEFQSL